MTEEELRQHILSATDRRGRGEQPPFADTAFPLHPSKPTDYELVRAEMYERILGRCDGVSISFNQEIIWFEVGMLWDASKSTTPATLILNSLRDTIVRLLLHFRNARPLEEASRAQYPVGDLCS